MNAQPAWQPSLFGFNEAPTFDATFARAQRSELAEGAWLEHTPGWLRGHLAVFDALAAGLGWHSASRPMYERTVEVPRLMASLAKDGDGHPLLWPMSAALSERYGVVFDRITFAYYRDGNDSVAWHGDYTLREREDDAVVATVSVGEPRKFLLRKTGAGGREKSLAYSLGWGDLMVMGGTCQRTWQHCVPKVAHAAPRIAIMFRSSEYL